MKQFRNIEDVMANTKQQKVIPILSDIIHLDLLIFIFLASWYQLVIQHFCEFPVQHKCILQQRKLLMVCLREGLCSFGAFLFLKLFLILKGNVFCLQTLLPQVMELEKCFQLLLVTSYEKEITLFSIHVVVRKETALKR